MSKDYAKFNRPNQFRDSRQKNQRVAVIIVLLIVMSVTITSVFFYTQKFAGHSNAMLSKIIAFVHTKKTPPGTIPPAKLATKAVDHTPPPVHFDFYEALPSMQMPVADNSSNGPTIAALRPVATTSKVIMVKPRIKTTIFNPAEVTDLLANEKSVLNTPIGQRYNLQLGTFESEEAAMRLSEAINSLGFQLKVVKTRSEGHNMYHVLQGPFATLESAKALQLRLQKRGITSTLKKA